MSDELSSIWGVVCDNLKSRGGYNPSALKSFIGTAKLTQIEQGTAHLQVTTRFAKGYIEKYAQQYILADLADLSGEPITNLVISIDSTPATKVKRVVTPRPEPVSDGPKLFEEKGNSLEPSAALSANLNPKYTFSTFIVGNRNRLAHAAAMAVADNPGKLYNPLYLYGGVGLGKTHLMQAVGNAIISRDPNKKVLYISCETFTNEFVESIKGGKREDFKRKYRNIDIFLVDDIQFMAGKDGTQEEFFHTFNTLYQKDRQIVITSDKVPSEIKELEERLASRFSMGMIADMQLPDLETREAILRAKCIERGIPLSDQVVSYIAEHVETNIRELEGALTTVLVQLQARGGGSVTVDEVRSMLKAFVNEQAPSKQSTTQILFNIVCQFYNISIEDLKGPRRQKELVRPRQILMYLLKNELGMSFPVIGRELGGRDHTTAIHSVDKIEKEMKKNIELLNELTRLKEMYYAHK